MLEKYTGILTIFGVNNGHLDFPVPNFIMNIYLLVFFTYRPNFKFSNIILSCINKVLYQQKFSRTLYYSRRLKRLKPEALRPKAVLPLRRRDCDSIKKEVALESPTSRTFSFQLHHHGRGRVAVALATEAPLRADGSASRRL
jgi:hypothetical protein